MTQNKTSKQELLKEKEELSTSILESMLEGILVVSTKGEVVKYNKKFLELYNIPEHIAAIGDDKLLLGLAASHVKHFEEFIKGIEKVYQDPGKPSHTIIEFINGQIIDRHSYPFIVNGEIKGTIWTFLDITENKKVEQELAVVENKYSQLLQFAPAAIFEFDYKTTHFNSVNNTMCSLTGFSREELLSMKAFDLLDAESKKMLRDRVQRSVNGEKLDEHVEFSAKFKNGNEVVVSFHIKRNFKDGQLDNAFVVAYDITERKQAEKVLQHTMQRFYDVLSNMNGSILLMTNDGRVEFVNQSFCIFFEFNCVPADLINLSTIQILEKIKNTYLHPDEEVERILELVDLNKPVKNEEVAITNDRTCLRDFIPIIIDGIPCGRLWHHIEITERKRAENEIKNTLQRFYSILSSMYGSIILITNEGRVEFVNQAFCDYFYLDCPPTDFINADASVIFNIVKAKYVNPDEEVARVMKLINEGTPIKNEQITLNDGRSCLQDFIPLFLDGKPFGRLWHHVEITKLKQAEEKLQKYTLELQDIVETKNKFLRIMSHDLINVFTGIYSSSDLLAKHADKYSTENIVEICQVLHNSAKRSLNIIQDLSTWSRTQTDSMECDMEKTDIRIIIDDCILNLETNAFNKQIKLHSQVNKNLDVLADEYMLRNILANLIGKEVVKS